MLELLGNPERARAMGRAGRERVLQHYTERKRGEAVEGFLSKILRLPPV
jgi:glycosyltransferase involved in cell wall biosynthesis